MILEDLYSLIEAVPPQAWEAVAKLLEEILAKDSPEAMVRHAEVLAAKAALGLAPGA
jgi:hypothetical protein